MRLRHRLELGMYDIAERAAVNARLAAEDEARRLADTTSISRCRMRCLQRRGAGRACGASQLDRPRRGRLRELFDAVGIGTELPSTRGEPELELKSPLLVRSA